MDVSLLHTPQAGPTCPLYRKTERKDKDVRRADRLLEPQSSLLFAYWVAFWFDPERMIVIGLIFGMWTTDGKGTMRISVSEVEGNYLMLRDNICLALIQPLFTHSAPWEIRNLFISGDRVKRDTSRCIYGCKKARNNMKRQITNKSHVRENRKGQIHKGQWLKVSLFLEHPSSAKHIFLNLRFIH